MKVEKFNVITQSILAFFERIGENAKEGISYLCDNKSAEVFDFVGVIGISGVLSGIMYVGVSHAMLRDLLTTLGESDISAEMINDLLDEIMGIVMHRTKDELGADFIVSMPVIFENNVPLQYLPRGKRSYVTPVYWQEHQAVFGICVYHKPKDF